MSKLRKEKGIVIRTFKYGESSLILDILTEASGLKSFIIQGVRKYKSRTSPSAVQLMASVDIDYYYKEDTELYQLKEIKNNEIWIELYGDMRKLSMGMFIAELTKKVVNKYENHQDIYFLLLETLRRLETGHDVWSIHIWYTVQLKLLTGFSLLQNSLNPDQYFDIKNNMVTGIRPIHGSYFDMEMMSLLKKLELIPIEEVEQIHISKSLKNDILNNLIDYFKVHIHNFTSIQSLEVLKTVF